MGRSERTSSAVEVPPCPPPSEPAHTGTSGIPRRSSVERASCARTLAGCSTATTPTHSTRERAASAYVEHKPEMAGQRPTGWLVAEAGRSSVRPGNSLWRASLRRASLPSLGHLVFHTGPCGEQDEEHLIVEVLARVHADKHLDSGADVPDALAAADPVRVTAAVCLDLRGRRVLCRHLDLLCPREAIDHGQDGRARSALDHVLQC